MNEITATTEQAHTDLVDGLAELIATARQQGLSLAEVTADIEGCLSVQCDDPPATPAYRLDFHDELTGEGGQLGDDQPSEVVAVGMAHTSWRDACNDMVPGTYSSLAWRRNTAGHMVGRGRYWAYDRYFTATYTIKSVREATP